MKKRIKEVLKDYATTTPVFPFSISLLMNGYIYIYVDKIVGLLSLIAAPILITWGVFVGYYTNNKYSKCKR